MNQRILLFIVIFLGFLIIVGTTVVITTVIERSKNVDFFENIGLKQSIFFCTKKCNFRRLFDSTGAKYFEKNLKVQFSQII